jgi:hypothetical protein
MLQPLAMSGVQNEEVEPVGRRSISALGMAAVALGLAAGAAAAGNHGKVGSTVTVKGQEKDVVAVTITKIEDPLLAYGADSGMREIGVIFTVKNVGKVAYSGSTAGFASTADGQIGGSQITGGGPCNPPAILKLAPGQTKSFCLPFAVLKSGKLAFIQFVTDSGYGTPAVFAAK